MPFAGVILVAIATSAGRHPSLAGVLLCLLAAVSYALAVVSQKPALRHAPALQVTTFGCAVGALACLPFTGQLVSQLATAPLTATLSAAYLGAFPPRWRSPPRRTRCREHRPARWAQPPTWTRP